MEVSVIIPVYNGAQYIKQAIMSALDQPQTREVIIVNDGSTDASLSICTTLARSDSRIKIVHHKGNINRGIATSSNLGIENACCPYLSFLDQDDYYLPGRFDKSLSILNTDKNIDGVYGKMKNISSSPQNRSVLNHPLLTNVKIVNPQDLFLYLIQDFNPHFGHCSVVYRTEKVKTINFDPKITFGTDVDFLYQVSEVLTLVDEDDIPKIMRRIHKENLSYSDEFIKYNPRLKMSLKWFNKIKDNSFSKKINRALFYRLITRMYFSNYSEELSLKRFPIKIYYGLKTILFNPWILRKI